MTVPHPSARYALGADGYFTRDGLRFIPVGANWWPGSCGVELWQAWPEEEIRRDLDLLVRLGLNCLRFFLRWQDFEPQAGHYDERQWARLEQLLEWCRERDIAAHPTLFVGFMSGGVFWPEWKGERNLFSDPVMRERSVAFARAATAVIARHAEVVLAIDQGNELCCLAESRLAPPAAIAAWCCAISAAVKEVAPDLLVISGNEQNQVVSDTGWRFAAQPGTDLYSMHGYPVTGWHPLAFDGMTDPLCQGLLPFYVRCARTFGPVLMQEFGTIATFGATQQQAYLTALLPAAWTAGANGFLWWCLRDITADIHPYRKVGMESTLGLVDDRGVVKPGLEGFIDFARSRAAAAPPSPDADAVGIYWPTEFYDRDNQQNPGNVPGQLSRRMLVADHLLRHLGHTSAVVRGDVPIPSALGTLLLTGACLGQDEWRQLRRWVLAGGHLVVDGIAALTLGRDALAVLGWVPLDYRAADPCRIEAFGTTWECSSFGHGLRLEVDPRGAQVAARDEQGRPAILVQDLGRGRVVSALPLMGDSIAAVAARRTERDRYAAWYRGLLTLVGVAVADR